MDKTAEIIWLAAALSDGELVTAVWAETNLHHRSPDHVAKLFEMMVLFQIAFRRLSLHNQAPSEILPLQIPFFPPDRHADPWHVFAFMHRTSVTVHPSRP